MERELVLVITGDDPELQFAQGCHALAIELGLLTEKAVLPHPAHFSPRTPQGQFRRPRFRQGERGVILHPVEATLRDVRGRFARRLTDTEQDVAEENVRKYVSELRARLQRHLFDFEAGHITSHSWFLRCREDIVHYYELAFAEGRRAAGDPALITTPTQHALLNRLVRDESDFLENFADDLDARRGKMPYAQRLGLYADALREAGWAGFIVGDLRRARLLKWTWGGTRERCSDCLRFERLGWISAMEFYNSVLAKGYLPQSGHLECQGHNCSCYIEEKVDGSVRRVRFVSAASAV